MTMIGNLYRDAVATIARELKVRASSGPLLRVYVMPNGEVRTRRRDDPELTQYFVGAYNAKSGIYRISADMRAVREERKK